MSLFFFICAHKNRHSYGAEGICHRLIIYLIFYYIKYIIWYILIGFILLLGKIVERKGKISMLLLQLKYFLAVAKYEHITKAAEQLHIAQPSLSQSMRRLEKELGVSLFEHRSRNIVLSEAGRQLVEIITPVIETMDSLPGRLKETQELHKKTIHLNIRAAASIITNGIISYKMLHPEIHFQVSQKEDPSGCDLCITSQISQSHKRVLESGGEGREERIVKKILEETFDLAVPANSAYAKRPYIDLAETAGEGYIGMNSSKLIRAICEQFCMAAGFSPQIIFESDVPSAVENLIGAGLGVGFWPKYTWGPIKTSNVVLVPIRHPDCRREVLVTFYNHSQENPNVMDFYQYIVSCIKKMKQGELPWQPSEETEEM